MILPAQSAKKDLSIAFDARCINAFNFLMKDFVYNIANQIIIKSLAQIGDKAEKAVAGLCVRSAAMLRKLAFYASNHLCVGWAFNLVIREIRWQK